jgi:gamma-D-glutamyl-L-lysine dipeptidyl-peptidase
LRRNRFNDACPSVLLTITIIAGCLCLEQHLSAQSPPHLTTDEIRGGLPMHDDVEDDEARTKRSVAFYHRLAAKAELDRAGKLARLPQYLELFKREVVKDARLFAFDVRASAADGAGDAITLDGFSEYVEQRDAVVGFLHALGFAKIDDRIKIAPAFAPDAKTFAIVNHPRTFLFDHASSPARETVSECTVGEPLYLLQDENDGHLLCHASDGYVGYVRAEHVVRVDQRQFDEYRGGDRAVLLQSTEHDGVRIPVGATLKAAPDGVLLPDGKSIRVDAEHVRRVTLYPRIERVIDTALKMVGTKYVWGGKTADGIDCSGLVQLAYRAHGVHLPRDSDQQALVGSLVATRWHRTGLRRGDTLFFLGRHGTITHTAIYLGEDKYIEAAGPDVRVSSFDPKHTAYAERNAKSFCFGRRIFE